MVSITPFLSTREIVIETLSPVLDVLYESLHQVLKFSTIYLMMLQYHQPFASIMVPQGTVCEYVGLFYHTYYVVA
jgi:hypothetical protein